MARKHLPKADAADRLGVSLRQLERYRQQGLPCRVDGSNRTTYPWPEIRAWRDQQIREEVRRQLQPTSIDEAERRKATADAELAELRLAKQRDQLMTVEEFDQRLGDAFHRVRAQLLTLEKKIPPEVVGCRTAGDALVIVRDHVEAVIRELQAADDVPDEDEDDDVSDGD